MIHSNAVHWILGGKSGRAPRVCPNLHAWVAFMADPARYRVDQTDVTLGVRVSTIFTGIDRSYADLEGEAPALFQTVVMGGPLDGHIFFAQSWEEAQGCHDGVLHALIPELAAALGIEA